MYIGSLSTWKEVSLNSNYGGPPVSLPVKLLRGELLEGNFLMPVDSAG
jgi:hypothetical protein